MILSVGILTYNQERYIRQCLDSVLMQEVDFEYEIVVGDDHSTDGTIAILEEYARSIDDRLKMIDKPHCTGIRVIKSDKNEGIGMNYKKMLSACKGKYIALCEGDDYWTDAHKLQEQVDFLEKHANYGFVGTYNSLLFSDGTMNDDPYNLLPKPIQEGEWELYGDLFDYAKCGPVTIRGRWRNNCTITTGMCRIDYYRRSCSRKIAIGMRMSWRIGRRIFG